MERHPCGPVVTIPKLKHSILLITGEKVDVAEVPTHLLISLSGAKPDVVNAAQKRCELWLQYGGVLAIGGGDGQDLHVSLADVPEFITVENRTWDTASSE